MIKVTTADIDRPVIYRPSPTDKGERGTIVGFNANYVFVRYGTDVTSKATLRTHLDYEHPDQK